MRLIRADLPRSSGWLGLLLGLACIAWSPQGLQGAAGLKLPKMFKICYRTDEHMDKCLVDAVTDALPKIKHGLPSYSIPSMDPIVLNRMDMTKGQGSVALRISFKNMTIQNFFDDISVKKASVDLHKLSVDVTFATSRLVSKGLYEVKGRVMVFPVNGHGHFSTTMYDPVVSIKINGKPVMRKDGLIYMTIEEVQVNQKPKRIALYFENIIHGDKLLSDNFNRFINDNWKVVFDEISPNLFKSLGDVLKSYFKGFFETVPFSEIFPESPAGPSSPPAAGAAAAAAATPSSENSTEASVVT